MTKKLTYEFVKESFEKEGYTLLSKKYKNAQTKLYYICPNGHKHSMKWNAFQQNDRCPYCSGNIKKTIDEIRKFFEKEGYTLLNKEYKNNRTKLKFICPNGHRHSTTWGNWQRGTRCRYCVNNNIKHTYSFIKEQFEKEGYTLLSQRYKNGRTKLNYVCPKGHKGSISWNSWHNGRRCYMCNGNVPLKYEDVKASFELENYVLLSTKYVNASSKLNYMCNKKHYGSITWTSWSQGHRCLQCAGTVKYSYESVKHSFEKEDYKLLSTKYINNSTKLEYTCPYGHKHTITFRDWNSGKRCPTCFHIKNSGPGNPAWRGGKSFEPYCEAWKDQEYKQDIRNRDGNKCLNPYCDSPDNTDLTIHHIDYDKKNCKPSNLITVCRSCNAKANTNRNWHKNWYNAIINRRYDYGN